MKLSEKILLTIIKDSDWETHKNIIQLMVKEVSIEEIFNLQSRLPHYIDHQNALTYSFKEKLVASLNNAELKKHLTFLQDNHILFPFNQILHGLKENHFDIQDSTLSILQQFLDLSETGKIQFIIGAYNTLNQEKNNYHYSQHPLFNYMKEVSLNYITEHNDDVEQLIYTFFKQHKDLKASEFTDFMRLIHKYMSWDVLFESDYIKRFVNVKAAFYLNSIEEKWRELQKNIVDHNISKELLQLMDEFEQLSHYFDGENNHSSLHNDAYISQQKAYLEKGLKSTLNRAIESGNKSIYTTKLLTKVETLFEKRILDESIKKNVPQGKAKIKL